MNQKNNTNNAILLTHWKSVRQMKDFSFIQPLKKLYPDAKVYLVGGAVRDILMQSQDIVDYDFVIRNVERKLLNAFLKQYGSVNLVGKKFGVYKFSARLGTLHEALDIALPRTETPTSAIGRHRDFTIKSNPHLHIEADLARRDFTINAMAWDVYNKILIDPYGGCADLKKKKIDTVGIPTRRLTEDLARILRAVRFACQLNMTIEPRVFKAIKRLTPKINTKNSKGEWVVPREVLAKELLKSFLYNPVLALDQYYESGLTKELMPELLRMRKCPQPKDYHAIGDVWDHTRLALQKVSSPAFKKRFPLAKPTILLIMAVLFHDIAKPLTIQTPKKDGTDRIRFNNHDVLGGKVAAKISKRLKFASWGEGELNTDALEWLIKKHLLLIHAKPDDIKNNTLEKYFFNDAVPGNELLQLFFADGAATISKNGRANLTHLTKLNKRLTNIKKIVTKKPRVSSIVNGDEIMKQYKLKPGPEIGRLLAVVREAQLSKKITTKKQALALIKKEMR